MILATTVPHVEAGNLLALTPNQWPTNNEIGFVVTPEILVLTATTNNGWCVVSIPTMGPTPGGCVTEPETVGLTILETINAALEEGVAPILDLSVPEPPEGHWAERALGAGHGCGRINNGDLWCWGYNNYWQLGNPLNNATTTPKIQTVKVNQPAPLKNVTAGAYHSCAQDFDNNTWCWGWNIHGQLGHNINTQTSNPNPVPTKVVTNQTFTQISAGWLHTCAVSTDQDVWCWGQNFHGQLGDTPNFEDSVASQPTPTLVSGNHKFRTVSVGWVSSCGVSTTNTIWCWGANSYGQLGTNMALETRTTTPIKLSSTLTPQTVKSGAYFTCQLNTNNQLYCNGQNQYGQLANPNIETHTAHPTEILVPTNQP
ncbi:MAG: hypothetical protein WDA77_11810 [Acidimicrobiia bacterium]